MKLASAIKKALAKKGISKEGLAKKVRGVHPSQVSRILRGQQKNPGIETVEAIAKAIGITAAELFGIQPEEAEYLKPDYIPVPVLGRVPAGTPIENMSPSDIQEIIISPQDELLKGKVYAAKVRGDSMTEAGINDGDYVLCRRHQQPANGDIVIARIDSEVTVKRFFKFDHQIILQAANPKYDPIVCTEEQPCEIIGVVVFVQRKLK